jgi:hypothetical protein
MEKEYKLEKFDSGMHFIMLDEKTVKVLSKNGNKRVICTINGTVNFHSALMPKKEGGYFINIGSATCKKLKIKEGSLVKASFEIDATEYQFSIPEELKEVLDSDDEAYKLFHNLTEGNQRSLMYLVQQVKSVDKRIERSLKIAEQIKAGITSPRKILQ